MCNTISSRHTIFLASFRLSGGLRISSAKTVTVAGTRPRVVAHYPYGMNSITPGRIAQASVCNAGPSFCHFALRNVSGPDCVLTDVVNMCDSPPPRFVPIFYRPLLHVEHHQGYRWLRGAAHGISIAIHGAIFGVLHHQR
jgi:hypothetical protein